jgi:hypothetical protein
MPIKRETLQALKKASRITGNAPDVHTARILIDSHLEALDALDGGRDAQERERQVRLALADLQAVLYTDPFTPVDLSKAQFVTELVDEMLKAKGPKWSREWAWYRPRIGEEFGS